MKSIEWNPKGQNYLSPLQRDAYERGEDVRKLDGTLSTDTAGNVWLRCDGTGKLLGVVTATGVRQDASSSPEANDSPVTPVKSAKRVRTRKARK